MINKRHLKSDFTIVANEAINDERLSFAATGLLIFLLSKPANWHINIEQLRARGSCGRDKIYKLINELCDAGYVVKRQMREPGTGAFIRHGYEVFDRPLPENQEVACSCEKPPLPDLPDTDSPHTGSPDTVNPHYNKNCIVVRTESNKPPKGPRGRNSYPPGFQAFWEEYPTTPNMPKLAAFKAWNKLTPDEQRDAFRSLPAYIRDLESEQWRKPVYAQRYLNERRFEGFAALGMAGEADPNEWQKRITTAEKTGMWSDRWGPPPGDPACEAPDQINTDNAAKAIAAKRAA